MFLSDGTIRRLIESKEISIEPFNDALVQPCSYDLTIADLELPRPLQFDHTIWSIPANTFVLGVTAERVKLPAHIAASVAGKSTWGRKGLTVHQTAGHIDPGFDGDIVLEIKNVSDKDVVVRKGTAIAQLVFTYLDQPAEHPYAGRYQHQVGITPARASVDYDLARMKREDIVHKANCDYPERACICR